VVAGDLTSSGNSGDGGPATLATFNGPFGASSDKSGNLYVVDSNNHLIRQIAGDTGIITTFAGTKGYSGRSGDGSYAVNCYLYYPYDVDVDASGNVYIADTYNHYIRVVYATTGIITAYAGVGGYTGSSGDGGYAYNAYLYYPRGIAFDISGNLYIADTYNHRIRKVVTSTGIISTIAGVNAYCYYPGLGCYMTPQNNLYYFNACYWTTTCSGTGYACAYCGYDATGVNCAFCSFSYSCAQCCVTQWSTTSSWYCSQNGVWYGYTGGGSASYIPNAGYYGDQMAATSTWLNYPMDVAVDKSGNVYIADTNNYRIRKVAASTGIITTAIGTGSYGMTTTDGLLGNATSLGAVNRLLIDSSNNLLYADSNVQRVRVMSLSTRRISTLAGAGTSASAVASGPSSSSRIVGPYAVGVSPYGDYYITDQSVVWKVQGEYDVIYIIFIFMLRLVIYLHI
jgi:NHL repeat